MSFTPPLELTHSCTFIHSFDLLSSTFLVPPSETGLPHEVHSARIGTDRYYSGPWFRFLGRAGPWGYLTLEERGALFLGEACACQSTPPGFPETLNWRFWQKGQGQEERRQGDSYLETTVCLRPRTRRSSFSCWRVDSFSSSSRFFSFCDKSERAREATKSHDTRCAVTSLLSVVTENTDSF